MNFVAAVARLVCLGSAYHVMQTLITGPVLKDLIKQFMSGIGMEIKVEDLKDTISGDSHVVYDSVLKLNWPTSKSEL